MKHGRVAVIMSVYDKDSLEFLKTAIDSILEQTYREFDIYIYFDGVKRCELWEYIRFVSREYGNIFFYSESINQGLAYALNYLLEKTKLVGGYQYIARMDADDISNCNRFYEQISYFEKHPKISILGSNCIEINNSGENIFHKKMPESHKEIHSFIFKRSPLVHPSVMFRYEMIDQIIYNPLLKQSQDYFLWIDLLSKGYKFGNVQKYLLKFRISDDFYDRRGKAKIFNEVKGRLYAINKFNAKNAKNYIYILCLVMLRVSPKIIKQICYRVMR